MDDLASTALDKAAMERELARLRTRVAELEDFLERAAEGLHMVGPDGTILWANESELAMLGYAREEYVGRKIQEFHVDQPVLDDFLDRLKRGETFHSLPARLWARDGTIRHVVVSSNGLFRDGEFVCTRCMTRDVTRERAAEEGLARLAAIVESTDDAVIAKDLQGIVTSWNPGAERVYGYRAQEMIGASIMKLVPPELHDEELGILSRLAAGERITHYETTRLAKSGARLHISLTISPIRDASGRIIGASNISRDISQRIEAERRKDEFLAILAHELRNPLAPVRNALVLLRGPRVSEENRSKALLIAERQTQQMARLLDDLLDVARITTGRVQLRKQVFDLEPILLHAVDATRSYAEARNQRIVLDLQAGGIRIDGDPVRIQQVVANLLHNAAKYSDTGARIELTCARTGDVATITVRDNGIGFGPELRSRLFTLFTQGEATGQRAAGGLGIGLALVREFVERHGGSVEARSDGPMRGSEFTVRIPCEPLACAPPESSPHTAAA
jgi:PAS domain S-box-containing protein